GALAMYFPAKTKHDRILILAPHPDDEALGCAGIIQKALKAGAALNIVFLTNGDSNQLAFIVYEKRLVFRKGEYLHMGEVRRKESIEAMRILGLPRDKLIFLGYPDFGTMAIFKNYWNSPRPFKSLLTRVSAVPYKEDFSYGKPYIGESILYDLEEVIRRYKPNKIFVSHMADTNSDHRALALFLQVALWDLRKQLDPHLKVYSYLVHHRGWPLPRHFHPQLGLEPPKNMQDAQIPWQVSPLSEEELDKKHQAILAYKSQTNSSAFYLLSFIRKNELFGNFDNIVLREASLKDQPVWTGHPDLLWEEANKEDMEEDPGAGGNSQIDYALKDGKIFIKLTLNKQPLMTDILFFFFGYKDSLVFRDMPKLRVKIMGDTVKVSDKRTVIKPEGVYHQTDGKIITVAIPLAMLNNPQSILTSVYASARGVSSEAASWRVIEIK
ncbi:MAG: PIG-L deacetylase family protein, partial [Candidatus Omnitrophota bacterium]